MNESQYVRMDWNGPAVSRKVKTTVMDIAKRGARLVQIDALRILAIKISRTGRLAREIDVRVSLFGDGYLVLAQGSKNYGKFYASFVELGTFKDPAQPYLRPALKKNRRKISQLYEDALK